MAQQRRLHGGPVHDGQRDGAEKGAVDGPFDEDEPPPEALPGALGDEEEEHHLHARRRFAWGGRRKSIRGEEMRR